MTDQDDANPSEPADDTAPPLNSRTARRPSTSAPTTRRGAEVVAAMVKLLPNGPGVYRMLSAAGDVLYVGKAKSLKKRVANYTRLGQLPTRILRMVQATASMEFVTTKTETGGAAA